LDRYRFRIRFQDRIGMARDVAAVVSGHDANIISLEVKPGEMHLQIGQVSDPALSGIVQQVGMIPDVLEVTPVRWLPHELNQQRLRSIFDAVEEGIIIADQFGKITMSNEKASEVLNPAQALTVLTLREAGFPPEIVSAIISGQLRQQDVPLKTPRGAIRCLIKSNAIFNEHGDLEGSMITFDKMSKVRRLAHFITQPVMVTVTTMSVPQLEPWRNWWERAQPMAPRPMMIAAARTVML